jgi:DNA-binding response OmpR family regulator
MRLLVAESDPALGTFLQRGFDAEHYAVDLTQNDEQARVMVKNRDYALAILDLQLPGDNGVELLRDVRAQREELPILILTSQSCVQDRVYILDMGADDFVLKPFACSELSARVRALLRRGGRGQETLLRIEDLELNRVERTVKRAGRSIELTPKEFSLLEYLMRNVRLPVPRAEIIRHVWNLSFDTQNVIQFHHTPELAPQPNGLVALVNLADLLCRLRGMGYGYEELREIDFQDAPAWALLQKSAPNLERFDIARFTMELDAEAEEIRRLVASAFQI